MISPTRLPGNPSAVSIPFERWSATALQPRTFVLGCWAIGRLIVIAAFLHVAHPSATAVANWDGAWYHAIAARGYEYARDGGYHSIAFFPLYPALAAVVMRLGIPFAIAGTIVNNVTFLAMLFVIFGWLERCHGGSAARWTIGFLAIFPLSLFGSVTYSEGTFMLFSALALRDFDRKRYYAASLWAALASLARPTGILLLPAFALSAIIERRERAALLAALSAASGVAAIGIFSAVRFGDALAFVHAQAAWRHSIPYGLHQWSVLLSCGSFWFGHWTMQLLVAPIVAILCLRRAHVKPIFRVLLWSLVVLVEHLCWGHDLAFAIIGILGTAALLYFGRTLGFAIVAYGFISLALFVFSGTTHSVDRYLFGTLSFSLALGLTLDRAPEFGAPLLAASGAHLFRSAAAFAESLWVA